MPTRRRADWSFWSTTNSRSRAPTRGRWGPRGSRSRPPPTAGGRGCRARATLRRHRQRHRDARDGRPRAAARRARARSRRSVHPHDRRARGRERRRRRWSTARSATSSSRSTSEELEEVVARAVRLHQMAKHQARGAGDVPPRGQAPRRSGRAGGALRQRDRDAVDRLPADRLVVAAQRRSPTRRWSATRSRRCARRPICSRRPSGWGACRSSGARSAIASRSTLDEQPDRRRCCSSTCTRMELDDDSLIVADGAAVAPRRARRPRGHRARAARADPRRHRARRAAARARLPHRRRRSRRRLRGADQLRPPRARGGQGRHVADPRASTGRR